MERIKTLGSHRTDILLKEWTVQVKTVVLELFAAEVRAASQAHDQFNHLLQIPGIVRCIGAITPRLKILVRHIVCHDPLSLQRHYVS